MKTFQQLQFKLLPESVQKGTSKVVFKTELDHLPVCEVDWIDLKGGSGALPTTIELSLDGASFFKGSLFQKQTVDSHKRKFVFLDPAHLDLFKTKMGLYLQIPLRSLIQEIAQPHKLDFIGDFSIPVAEFCLDGHTTLENLQRLAIEFGFFIDFKHEVISFVQVGKTNGQYLLPSEWTKSVSLETKATQAPKGITLHFFDSHQSQLRTQVISESELYQTLQPFQSAESKKYLSPAVEIKSNSKSHFEESKKKIPFQYSRYFLTRKLIRFKTRNIFSKNTTMLSVPLVSETLKSFVYKQTFDLRGDTCLIDSEAFYV